MSVHAFYKTKTDVDWDNLIIFDIETVATIEEMRRLKESDDIDLTYLDVRNAKYVAFAVHEKHKKLHLAHFRSRKDGEWRIYYNVGPLNYYDIASTLLESAIELGVKGFCAHNGNKFDFLIFLHAGMRIRNVKKALTLYAYGKRFKLVDTLHIARACGAASLDALARTFGVRGKNLDSAQTIQEYVINDVGVLTRVIQKFKTLGIKDTPTRTGRAYVYAEMDKRGIKRIKSTLNFVLDYAGGRVEPFRHYARAGNVYDANSLYPSVMAHFLFPACAVEGSTAFIKTFKVSSEFAKSAIVENNETALQSLKSFTPFEIKNAFENAYSDMQYLVHIRVKGVNERFKAAEKILLNYFPFGYLDADGKRKFHLNEKAVYQVQSYELFWLVFYDFEVIDAVAFPVERYIFAELYERLYEKRLQLKKKKDMRQLLYKIAMNSSYGILGLRDDFINELKPHELRAIIEKKAKFIEKVKERTRFGHYGIEYRNKVEYERYFVAKDEPYCAHYGRKFSYLSVPLWATTITSHARFWLQSVIFSLAFKGYEVFYCDTDSVFTDAPLEVFNELQLLGDKMLQWKYEYSFSDGFFFNPKTYVLRVNGETKIKAKGVGSTLYRRLVVQSEKNPLPRIMFKRIFNPESVPKKIPAANGFESVYNVQDIKFAEAFAELLKEFVMCYPELEQQLLTVLEQAQELRA
jgi:hypothetical protein